MIVAIPATLSESAKQFFERGGKVEIPRPEACEYAGCLRRSPLRGNGSYVRQVVYWGALFLVHIFRFRCGGCGKTVSCPYSWLVPYRRFVAQAMAAGIESYATARETYLGVSTDLSDPAFIEPEMDIRSTQAYKSLLGEKEAGEASGRVQKPTSVQVHGESAALKAGAVKESAGGASKRCRQCLVAPKQGQTSKSFEYRPAHTTVWYWVELLSRRSEELLMQIQKEFVLDWKRGKAAAIAPPVPATVNPNSDKAFTADKATRLDRLTQTSLAAEALLHLDRRVWEELRAYFLTKAESCKDVLTLVYARLATAHTFELSIF